eukprot:12891317-Alexandrium_andersonii.AAC.1
MSASLVGSEMCIRDRGTSGSSAYLVFHFCSGSPLLRAALRASASTGQCLPHSSKHATALQAVCNRLGRLRAASISVL